MARYDNTYSRLVGWFKVILPLAALAILSTVFLVSQRPSPSGGLPYGALEGDQPLREQSIVAPDYSGVTDDGARVSLTALMVRPGSGGDGDADGLRMVIDTPDGATLRLFAEVAALDMAMRRAMLSDGVRIETSDGFALNSLSVNAALDVTRIEAPSEVSGTAPFGQLRAGSMLVTRGSGASDAGNVLLFSEGVDLIYEPKENQGGRQ